MRDVLISFNLKQTIYEAARGESCPDNIFLDNNIGVSLARVVDLGFSDHLGQLVDFMIPMKGAKILENEYTFRPITQKGMYYNKLSERDWDFVNDTSMNVDEKFSGFVGIVENTFLEYFPEKTYRARSNKPHKINWFNNELKIMREQVAFLHDLSKQYHGAEIYRMYKELQKAYRAEICRAKVRANNNLIQASHNPTRTIWDIINSHRGIPRNKNQPEILTITPDSFNHFFAESADKLIKDIPFVNFCFPDKVDYTAPTNKFQLSQTSHNQVRDIISNFLDT